MNVLALDYGLKRIGIAVGSTESGIAFTRPPLVNDTYTVDRLLEILQEEDIHQILLGLPLKHSGEKGDIQDDIAVFVQKLNERTDVPIEWVNERFTTKMAQKKLDELQLKASEKIHARKSGERDSMAAQVMLQEWLDNQ